MPLGKCQSRPLIADLNIFTWNVLKIPSNKSRYISFVLHVYLEIYTSTCADKI